MSKTAKKAGASRVLTFERKAARSATPRDAEPDIDTLREKVTAELRDVLAAQGRTLTLQDQLIKQALGIIARQRDQITTLIAIKGNHDQRDE